MVSGGLLWITAVDRSLGHGLGHAGHKVPITLRYPDVRVAVGRAAGPGFGRASTQTITDFVSAGSRSRNSAADDGVGATLVGMDETAARNDSVLGRLLEELSWVGPLIREYRQGGRGYENVLTAEALQALDFLPRQAFLGQVIRDSRGADVTRLLLADEIESATTTLLPDELKLGRPEDSVGVQPDGLIEAPGVLVLLEAKRIRPSAFQPEQLARELLCTLGEAGDRRPLLWLLLGEEPPVRVKGHGRLSIVDAVALALPRVLERCDDPHDSDQLLSRVDEFVAWTTWHQLQMTVRAALDTYACDDPSTLASVCRLAVSVIHAVDRHA